MDRNWHRHSQRRVSVLESRWGFHLLFRRQPLLSDKDITRAASFQSMGLYPLVPTTGIVSTSSWMTRVLWMVIYRFAEDQLDCTSGGHHSAAVAPPWPYAPAKTHAQNNSKIKPDSRTFPVDCGKLKYQRGVAQIAITEVFRSTSVWPDFVPRIRLGWNSANSLEL